jgi:branched-chain amino acid transport system substrate-binding protein
MADEVKPDSTRARRWLGDTWRFVSKWFVLPLLGALLGAMLIGRIIDWIIGPKAYKVYVVGNFQDSRAANAIWEAILKGGTLGKIDGIPVELEKANDGGDPLSAQRISADLAGRNDSLLVIGHFASTQTKAALPAYLRTANPPIPVILTTETNPNLSPPKPHEDTYDPMFRLSPTDDEQAKKAADFAIGKKAHGFWVVEDLSNPVYSDFLARKFSEHVLEHGSQVLLWTNNLSFPPVQTIKTLNVDWVFFAGSWQDALILLRQLRAMPGGEQVNVVLSDASVDQRLIDQGGLAIKDVFLTHPMLAEDYNGPSGFGAYGSSASQIVRQLLDGANDQFGQVASANGGFGYWYRHLLGLRRATDARIVIAALMKDAVIQERRLEFEVTVMMRDLGWSVGSVASLASLAGRSASRPQPAPRTTAIPVRRTSRCFRVASKTQVSQQLPDQIQGCRIAARRPGSGLRKLRGPADPQSVSRSPGQSTRSCGIRSRGPRKYCMGEEKRKFDTRLVYTQA